MYVSKKLGAPGALVLGGMNENLIAVDASTGSKKEVAYHQGKSDSYWMVEIVSMKIQDPDANTLMEEVSRVILSKMV